MRRLPTLLVLALLLAPASAPAAPRAELRTFANGLRLLVLPRPEARFVEVDIDVSLPGGETRPGLAHLVEHMLFTSTVQAPDGSVIDSLLLNTLDFRGTTSLQAIHLGSRCLPDRLGRVLAVEAGRLGGTRPAPAELEYERERILGEHDLRNELSTRHALDTRLMALAYAPTPGGGDPLLGRPEDIRALTMADVEGFLAAGLRPGRTVVLVTGPVDADSVATRVEAALGALPAAAAADTTVPLPPRPAPPPPCYVTRSDDAADLLAVAFRLPCATPRQLAMVHVADTILEREGGRTALSFYRDEALLTVHLPGRWSTDRTDSAAAALALEQFWDETRKVVRRVDNAWLFDRNRGALVADLRERVGDPLRAARWQARRLAARGEAADPAVLAALVDTLAQDSVAVFFMTQLTEERGFTAFAAGREPRDRWSHGWSRYMRLRINPYARFRRDRGTLTARDIRPVLAAARGLGLGRNSAVVLKNGLEVRVLDAAAGDDLYLGGVRVFPFLEGEGAGREPGRLILYQWLANVGYNRAGARIEPYGEGLDWDTTLEVQPHSLVVTAHGPAADAAGVAAAVRKRLKVDKLNQYAFRHAVDQRGEWLQPLREMPRLRAMSWRLGALFGDDHPLAGWLQPDLDRLAAWSVGGADKMHRTVCRSENLVFVAAGGVTPAEAAAWCGGTLDELDRPRSDPGPVLPAPAAGVHGLVVHDSTASVATVRLLYPGRRLEDGPAPGPVDLAVLENVVGARLDGALAAAGCAASDVAVGMVPVGRHPLPEILLVVPPADAALALATARAEVARLAAAPVDADEEARARLLLLGPLLRDLEDPEDARDFLLGCGLTGAVPADPLADLCTPRTALLATEAPRLFPPETLAWTVVVDTTLADAVLPDPAAP